jgi:hypothetical protein
MLIERAVRSLLDVQWSLVFNKVRDLMDANLSGEAKREIAYKYMRELRSSMPTWLINIAIEVAYVKLTESKRPPT